MSQSITVTFWGVRGSHPAPGPSTNYYGGNTSSIEVRAGNQLIILDAGTGIIGLGRKLAQANKVPLVATLLFTHTHHDHTQGFPFFVPAFFQSSRLYIYGPKTLHQDLQEVLARTVMPPAFPITLEDLPCERIVRNIHEAEVIVLHSDNSEPTIYRAGPEPVPVNADSVRIHVMRSFAHPQGVFYYRIQFGDKAIVLATDTEGYIGGDRRLARFAKGAQLLIHDAQYSEEEYANPVLPKQGWGHSTWQMAVDVARLAGVERLALYHHEPTHTDDELRMLEREAQQAFPDTAMGCEGMVIEV